MTAVIHDPQLERTLIRRRKRLGLDRFDEVWEGVYVVSPAPNNEHQQIAGTLDTILRVVIEWGRLGTVLPAPNISDRRRGWRQNFRVPETAVFLNGAAAVNCRTHWQGGPDFCVEISSAAERIREKLAFYAAVGTREVLLIERRPWRLELFRLGGDELISTGQSTAENSLWLHAEQVPLEFRLTAGDSRPTIQVRRHDDSESWTI